MSEKMARLDFARSFSAVEVEKLQPKVMAALEFFPEIAAMEVLKIGRLRPRGRLKGQAIYASMQIRLVPAASMHTVGHELMHLAAQLGRQLPKSEVATDVFTVALHDAFNDDYCTYVDHAKHIWLRDRTKFRQLMIHGVELYRRHGKYRWYRLLREELEITRNSMSESLI
jgi:hypothetical protein